MPKNQRSLSNHRVMNPAIASPAVYIKDDEGKKLKFLYARQDSLLNQQEVNYIRRMQLEVKLKGETLRNIHLDPKLHPISWPVFIGHDGQAIVYYHQRTVGRGHFGAVHLGLNIDTGEPVAVKVTTPNFGQSFFKARAGSFSRHSRFAKAFKNFPATPNHTFHKNETILDEANLCRLAGTLVDYADIVIDGTQTIYIAQQLVWGETLQDIFEVQGQRVKMPLSRQLKIMLESAKAVSHFHALGFVHRDIKSSNIMWDEKQQRAHLIDFGKAVPISNALYPMDLYAFNASPECLTAKYTHKQSQCRFSLSSEMYSFGVMMAQLLSKFSHEYIQHETMQNADPNDLGQSIPKSFINTVSDVFQKIESSPIKRCFQLMIWKMMSVQAHERPSFDWVIKHVNFLLDEAYRFENFDHRHQDFKLNVKGQILLKDLEQTFKERLNTLQARAFNKKLKKVTKDMECMSLNYIRSLYMNKETPEPNIPLLVGYVEDQSFPKKEQSTSSKTQVSFSHPF